MDRPDPGWYPDPEQPGRVRYYDGERWTDQRRATAPSAPTEDGLPPGEAPRADARSTSPTEPMDATGPAEPTAGSAAATAASATPGRPDGARRNNVMMLVLAGVAVLVLGYLASTFVGSAGTGDDQPDGADSAEPDTPADDAASSEDPATASDAPDDAIADDATEEPSGAEGSDEGAASDDTEAQEPEGDAEEDPDRTDDTGSGSETDGVPFDLELDPEADHLASIVTSEGTITVSLDVAAAPLAANNLAHLAEDGYYDGVLFHRVIEDFVIQAGDPTGTGSGGPGYRFDDELATAEEHVAEHGGYPRGTLAMANAGPDSNGSQFFIVHGELVELEPLYTVFGEVVEGMDVVDAIAATPADNADRPTTDITIETVEVTTD